MFKNRKTSELTGVALNWAVSKAEGFDADALVQLSRRVPGKDSGFFLSKYSTDWAKGGPIIERERILIQPELGKEGSGNAWNAISMHDTEAYGPTPLIAAMRCYVASKLGDVVKIPEELE